MWKIPNLLNHLNLIELYQLILINKSIYHQLISYYRNTYQKYKHLINKHDKQILYLLGGGKIFNYGYILPSSNKLNELDITSIDSTYNNIIFTQDLYQNKLIMINYKEVKKFGNYLYTYLDKMLLTQDKSSWYLHNAIIIDKGIINEKGIKLLNTFNKILSKLHY